MNFELSDFTATLIYFYALIFVVVKLSLYPLDVSYKIMNDRAVIHVYGRTPDGAQVCVKDELFEPYFLVLPKKGSEAIEVSQELAGMHITQEDKEFFVTRVEVIRKRFIEKEVSALKVFVNLPKSVPVVQESIRKQGHTPFEFDILFTKRYILDKGFTPCMLLDVDAEPSTENSKVPVFTATSVAPSQTQHTLDSPRVLALDIETYNPLGKNIIAEQHPILMLAVYAPGFERVLCWKRFANPDKTIEFVDSESELLERFKQLIAEFKPDILAGYYSDGFDLPYIIKRAAKYKITLDLGLDHSEPRMMGRSQTQVEITGIVHLDVFKFIRKIIGRSMTTDVFTLDAVATELLGDKKHAVDVERLAHVWDNDSEKLAEYCLYNLHDARLTHKLVEKVFPVMLEFVKIIGQNLFDINRMTFSQLVEGLIMKHAVLCNEIILNKPSFTEERQRRMHRLHGAFVYEPTPSVYKNIVVFDYRSLFPSIIASHNISLGTLNCSCCEDKDVVPIDYDTANSEKKMWYCTRRKGFISMIIEDLITRRARVKELLKQNKGDKMLAARSEALKVLANSFYGYLSFSPARWYCFACGESTTAWSRFYIKKVIAAAGEQGFHVLYGDTDSIFLELGEKSHDDAIHFQERINKELPDLMELDLESFYPRGIFVGVRAGEGGAKKKYALLDEKDVMKIRGFETVRRNSARIARDVQREVLEIVLKKADISKAVAHVKKTVSDLQLNKIPIGKVVIQTQLQRNVESYASFGPHVAAAQRMKNKSIPVGPGTMLRYVITKGAGKIRDKVRLEDEALQTDYDGEYYVQNHVIPSVEKIFEAVGVDILSEVLPKKQHTLQGFF